MCPASGSGPGVTRDLLRAWLLQRGVCIPVINKSSGRRPSYERTEVVLTVQASREGCMCFFWDRGGQRQWGGG